MMGLADPTLNVNFNIAFLKLMEKIITEMLKYLYKLEWWNNYRLKKNLEETI